MTRKQQHVFSPQAHMYLYEAQNCITLQTDDLQLVLFSFCLPLKSESLHSLCLFIYLFIYFISSSQRCFYTTLPIICSLKASALAIEQDRFTSTFKR